MGFINQRSHLWGAPSCNWQFQNNVQVANVGIGMPREEQELAGSYMERDNFWFSEFSVELPGNSWGISWMMYFWGASAAPHRGGVSGCFWSNLTASLMWWIRWWSPSYVSLQDSHSCAKCFKLGMFGMNAIAIDSLEKNSVTFLEMTWELWDDEMGVNHRIMEADKMDTQKDSTWSDGAALELLNSNSDSAWKSWHFDTIQTIRIPSGKLT